MMRGFFGRDGLVASAAYALLDNTMPLNQAGPPCTGPGSGSAAMTNGQLGLLDLVQRNDYRSLEDRWLIAIEEFRDARDELLETLDQLTKNGKGEMAAALGWSWLTTERERSKPTDVLALGRELMLRCGDSQEMRKEILGLYRELFAERPEFERLIEASGLTGDKSPRRALRTLEICLNLKAGDLLLSRSEERAAEVAEIDPERWEFTLRSKRGEDTLDADTLALKYDPVGPNDFRALAQLYPERITALLDSDPASLVIGLLHSHRGQLDSEELKHALVPKYLPATKWSSWWTKARAQLNRSKNVVLEGRNPIVITYHATEQTLEDEIAPLWAEGDTPAKRLSVIDTYFREARARGVEPDTGMIEQLYSDLAGRVAASRKGSPGHALVEALLIDRLLKDAPLPGKESPAREIVAGAADLVQLMTSIDEPRFFVRALDHAKAVRQDDWPDLYLQLLPCAPVDGCDVMAAELIEAGHGERLKTVAEHVLSDFGAHLDAVCWLWRGKVGTTLEPISSRELLLRLLDHLGKVSRDDRYAAQVLRDTRTKIRSALSAANYSRYRKVIEGMESGLASTIRTTVDRLDGLGHTVRINLMKIVTDTHPELVVSRAKQVDPWEDDNITFCTQQGYARRKEEIDFLTKVKIPENARAIGEAASRGDLSENSEYKFALEERDLLQARLMKMQTEFSLARLLNADDVNTSQVDIGTHVQLVSTDGSSRREVTILGPFEGDIDRDIYNYKAPLCGKLRGLHPGDTAKVDLGIGEMEYRIESIANAMVARKD